MLRNTIKKNIICFLFIISLILTGCNGMQISNSQYIECSICHEKNDVSHKYCAHCGSGLSGQNATDKVCSLSGCSNKKYLASQYCEKHSCNAGGCTSQAIDNLNYCSNHKCIENKCAEIRKSGYEYCNKHFTEKYCSNCKKNLRANELYCSSCKCLACDRKVEYDTPYCGTHCCYVGGCTNRAHEVNNIIYRYCVGHKCTVPNCAQQRQGDLPYCPQHLWELDYDH